MNVNYQRVRITGRLVTDSDLHLGNGDFAYQNKKLKNHPDEKFPKYQQICLDHNNQPYLPATSLRGLLARFARLSEVSHYEKLFGKMGENHDDSCAGALRVHDAPLIGKLDKPILRHHANIDPVTGTTQAHKLFTLSTVSKGHDFDAVFELDKVDEDVLQTLLALLASWDGSAQSAIGSGRSKGRGRLIWNCEKIETLTESELHDWLSDSTEAPLPYQIRNRIAGSKTALNALPSIELHLFPEHVFLINDPERCEPKTVDNPNPPDLVFQRSPDGHAVIPATSLRGWLRGQIQRILRTCWYLEKDEDTLLKDENTILLELFGGEKQQGVIYLDDAVATEQTTGLEQFFNAVDRSTGGVADTALYSVQAADCQELICRVSVTMLDKLNSKHRALLLLVCRDILEGDLQLGWGKSRGYGQFRVEMKIDDICIKNWEDLLKYLEKYSYSQNILEGWMEALHN